MSSAQAMPSDAKPSADEHVHGPGCDHDHAPEIPYRRESAKVGRNDPCPCGSGKKFKKCCA
jgi:uncharacterized protein YecA (UPF0149 family)